MSRNYWGSSPPIWVALAVVVVGGLWMAGLVWGLWRTRARGDPLLLLTAAAAAPFLLLHYPTHLAIGVIPLVIVLARQLAAAPIRQVPAAPGAVRFSLAILLFAVAAAGTVWQLRRVAIDVWTAELERGLGFAVAATEPMRRTQLATAVECSECELAFG